MFDLIHEIAQTLRNNRLRTFLTGISVAWGIFMLIVLLGAARGVTNSFNENMGSMDYNTVNVWQGITSKPWKGYKDGRWIVLKGSDRKAIMSDNPETVSDVAAFASVDTAKISSPKYTLTDGFQAVYPKAQSGDRVKMLYGRFINDRDIEAARRVMVIHKDKAELLFDKAENALGKTVSSMGLAWTVVGVYRHDWRSQSYAPYTTYKAITGNNDEAYQLTVTVEGLKTQEDADKVDKDIRASLAKAHQFDPDDNSAVWMWNRFSSYLSNQEGSRILKTAVWLIGLLTLLTGVVGVSNIMFVSVRERTHEIGIRRAIGAKPRSILSQVLAESIGITALFGYIGVFFGMVTLQIVDMFTKNVPGFTNPTVDISIAVEVTIALVVAGAAAGLFPALKAIKVKPVEALRDE